MKKFIVLFLALVLVSTSLVFGVTGEVIVTIPEFDVSVDDVKIDTAHSQYPVITYKNVTYFPMTSDYLSGIGLDLSFDASSGLELNTTSKSGQLEQKFLGASNVLGSSSNAQIAPFPIKVNGKVVDNGSEAYPVLLYKNVTYFPMTWRFAVTEFNWKTSWDDVKGFGILIEGSQTKEGETSNKEETEGSIFDGYKLVEVDGGDLSGHRQANVVVDVGFGERRYYAFTNAYGQLVKVIADEIVLQDETNEPVKSTGRYYYDEAKVPGTESTHLDEGHVIADSLGGVANAYNITPQNSTLNRHGDQAYMEKVIRDAGGCSDFEAIITYPDNQTQIPSHYQFTYTIMGNQIVDSFDNINPDIANEEINNTNIDTNTETNINEDDISKIDTNGNGRVTIAEAEAAGFTMPIYSTHWLYKYMTDRDGDGMVGE